MSDLPLADKKTLLLQQGAALGITSAQILDWIKEFGPDIAALLIQLLANKRSLAATPTTPNALQQLLIVFLTTYQAQIESWIDTGEGAVFDAVIGLVGTKSAVLAALLQQYKTQVVAAGDAATTQTIDAVIAILKGN